VGLVDTHCHIQSIGREAGERGTRQLWSKAPELSAGQVIADAAAAGVTRLVCVGCDLEDSQLAVDFVQAKQNCWASVGIHPHEAKHLADQDDKLDEFAQLASQPKVVAIGECGLDYYYQHSPKDAQLKVLKFQIELAQKYDLPIIFHVREAFDDFWPVFDSYSGLRGVVHSFTDSAENMRRAIDRDLYVGINGIATFTKSEQQLAVYREVPLEKLLLETDAPFLAPAPHRGRVNQPAQVATVADFLAKLRGEDLAALARATTTNARQLFGL
jgi:TatD DNase family protein